MTVIDAIDFIEKCTGCGACSQICPHDAIVMIKDKYGFLRPEIIDQRCTNCGLCARRCIALHPMIKNNNTPLCYAVMAKDEVRKISSSGGMFTVAAEYILNLGGYVCGAIFTSNFEVEHIIVDNIDNLKKLRGSKYMQSNTGNIFSDIKKLLEKEALVLFTGMPCQVAGLKSFLNKDYENLISMDLLCHGITSSKIFEKYRKDVLEGKELVRLEFKAKEPWGWHAGVNAYFADGTTYSKPCESDPYFKSYLNGLSKNFACGVCAVNRLPRQGDLTIGDFWKVQEIDPKLNDNKGTSIVLLNNDKAESFFNKIKGLFSVVREGDLDVAKRGNSIVRPHPLHKNRIQFFRNFNKLTFSSNEKGCLENRIYEQQYIELCKSVPSEEHELYYIAKVAAENSHGRKIVTWIRSSRFEKILKRYFGLSVAFGVSQRPEALVKGRIEDFSTLKGKCAEYYLVSLDRSYDEPTYSLLNSFGYREIKDFVFRKFKPIIFENIDLAKGNYYDEFGNSIEGFDSIVGKVILRGFNNHIFLGKNISFGKNLEIDLCANSIVDIKENNKFNAVTKIQSYGDTSAEKRIIIKNNCIFSEGALFRIWHKGSILINDSCTFSSYIRLAANMGKNIIIGHDCMFSYNIQIQSGDGHSIFDVSTGKCINKSKDTYDSKDFVIIGDHTWIGFDAFILAGTNIGAGSIIGARSVVKGIFPNNCIVAGNPARQIKANIAWSRDSLHGGIDSCGQPKFVATTSHACSPISGRKVLVIGGTRFMGVQLVKQLITLGNEVIIATRGRVKDGFGMYVKRLVLDVSNAESVKTALQGKYFDVVFDNLAYCSKYVNNVLSNVSCGRYIQLSSVASYLNMVIDIKESYFDPYQIKPELVDVNISYEKCKRYAEAVAFQNFKNISISTVRVPYVTKTDRLLYYCTNIVNQLPMNIDDVSRGFTFIRDTEVGNFLPWLAAQDCTGPINLASEGYVTIKMILDYIEFKTGKNAIIDEKSKSKSPFMFNGKVFSMNMDKAKQLGYKTSNINDWFWKLMDEYIALSMRKK